jgi:hypothetical protein
VDETIKELLQELGTSVNDAVSRSSRVKAVMQAIREHGYEAYLVLEANLAAGDKTDQQDSDHFTEDDRNFLKRLRIEC